MVTQKTASEVLALTRQAVKVPLSGFFTVNEPLFFNILRLNILNI